MNKLILIILLFPSLAFCKPVWKGENPVEVDLYPENEEIFIVDVIETKTLEYIKSLCRRSNREDVLIRYDPVLTGPVSMDYRGYVKNPETGIREWQEVHSDNVYIADEDFCDLALQVNPERWVCYKAKDRHLERNEGCY